MSGRTTESLMSQAQVFASAWALVGGRFDTGNAMEDAEAAKAELAQVVGEVVQQRNQLLAALKRLSDAALSRDITMGDACNLIAVKEELAAANRQAMAVILNVTGEGVRNEPV